MTDTHNSATHNNKRSFPTDSFESQMLVTLQNNIPAREKVQAFARGLSYFGEHSLGWLGLSALGALLSSQPAKKKAWVKVGVSAFIAHALSVVIKRIIRRPRPHDERINIGVGTPSKLSFPSSHATSTTAALVGVAKIVDSPWPLVGVPIMMASRAVLGVHYPTDVTVGAFLGALTTAIVMKKEN